MDQEGNRKETKICPVCGLPLIELEAHNQKYHSTCKPTVEFLHKLKYNLFKQIEQIDKLLGNDG